MDQSRVFEQFGRKVGIVGALRMGAGVPKEGALTWHRQLYDPNRQTSGLGVPV